MVPPGWGSAHGTGPWEVILVVGTGSELVPAAFVGVGPCPSDDYATSGLPLRTSGETEAQSEYVLPRATRPASLSEKRKCLRVRRTGENWQGATEVKMAGSWRNLGLPQPPLPSSSPSLWESGGQGLKGSSREGQMLPAQSGERFWLQAQARCCQVSSPSIWKELNRCNWSVAGPWGPRLLLTHC